MNNLSLRAKRSNLLFFFLFCSCSVGPDYQRPNFALPDKYLSTDAADSLPQENLASWWTRFNDPVLNTLIDEAVRSNLDLKSASARLREARAARSFARGEFFPIIDGNAEYQRQRNRGGDSNVGQSSPGGVVSTGSEQDLFQAGFDAAWELDVFGGVRRRYESAAASAQAALEDQRDVLVTLLSETAASYLTLRGLQEELAIVRKNLELQREGLDLTQRRFESGFAAALDVANARAEVERTSGDVPLLELSIQQQLFAIAVLLGRAPSGLPEGIVKAKSFPPISGEIPAGLPSELLERRPDIRRAEAELHAATAEVGVAESDWFPKFSLTGSISLTGDSFSSLGNWDNRVWRIGPSVFWPILDFGRIRANIVVQDARAEQALIAFEKAIVVAFQEVESSLVSFEKQRERQVALSASVEANTRALELSTKLYREGLSDFLSVLTAERALLAAEVAQSQSKRQHALAVISLYKALGGGWESNPVENSR